MQLVSDQLNHSAPKHLLLPLDPMWNAESAANDSGIFRRNEDHPSCDLNVLVTKVLGHVTNHVRPERANVTLSLAPGRPIVHVDPIELAFAISGTLTASLRAMEDSDSGDLRVETRLEGDSAQVFIAGSDLPPLGFVRAVEPSCPPGATDPTLAHCRRLVEGYGGRIDLVERDGWIGFAIMLPTYPVSTTSNAFYLATIHDEFERARRRAA